MTGSLHHQLNLLMDLEIYERAEKLVRWFPAIRGLQLEADQKHDALLKTALKCGFNPGGLDGHLTVIAWATKRAELIREHLPNNARKAA